MTKPIRVLLVATGLAIEGQSGGITRFVVDLAQAFNREQVEPVVAGLWNYGESYEQTQRCRLEAAGIEVIIGARWQRRASVLNVAFTFRGLLAALTRRPVDIIHVHSEFAEFPAIWLRAFTRTPVLIRTLHNREWIRRPWLRPLARAIYPLTYEAEIGISPDVVNSLDARWLAQRLGRQALYLPNAVNLQRFAGPIRASVETRQALGLSPQAVLIGSVGRLAKQKGYEYLLKAAPLVLAYLPQAHFLLMGDGPLKAELRHLAGQLGLEAHVTFAGPRSDIEACLGCLDLFVSASLWEGLPTVIMESMAAGTPVVATNIPGSRELVQPGLTGWLAPPGDPSALAAVILEALQDRDRRCQYALAAKESVRLYSIEAVAAHHTELYRQLWEKRK